MLQLLKMALFIITGVSSGSGCFGGKPAVVEAVEDSSWPQGKEEEGG